MSMEFRIEGLDKLIKRIRTTDAARKMAGALNLEAELIMTQAKRVTPVAPDGGTLRSSGHVQKPVIRRHTAKVVLGFGGAASAYALAVHEHPSKHSPPSWQGKVINWNVGGPKYLEKPMKQVRKNLGRRIKSHLDLF